MLAQGFDIEDVIEDVLAATQEKAPPGWNWDREERAVRGMCESWLKKNPDIAKRNERRLKREPQAPRVAVGASSASGENAFTTRDDDLPAGDNVVSLAHARAERGIKKEKPKNAHVVLGKGLLEALAERGEKIIYEEGVAYWYKDGVWERLSAEREHLAAEIEAGCQAIELVSRDALISEVVGWIRRQPNLQRTNVPWDEHGLVITRSGAIDPASGVLQLIVPEMYATHRLERIRCHGQVPVVGALARGLHAKPEDERDRAGGGRRRAAGEQATKDDARPSVRRAEQNWQVHRDHHHRRLPVR
jgi:hypothetical protein